MKAIVLVVMCITSYVSSERFGILQKDGSILYFDEKFDEKTNTSTVVFETMQEPNLNTIALHDFTKGYEVFKEVKRGLCLIASLSIHKPKYITPHLLATPPTKQFRIDHTDLQYTDVMNTAGPVAAEFCRGYTTRFLVEIPQGTIVKRDSDVYVHCGGCTGEIQAVDLPVSEILVADPWRQDPSGFLLGRPASGILP